MVTARVWRTLTAVFLLAAVFGAFLGAAYAQSPLPVPALSGRVIDQTGTLDATQRQVLEAKLAAFEQETLTRVIEARAKATSIQVTPETLNNPEAFNKFQQAQGELSGALSRLMVVAERYPTLQANQAFRDLRVTLEGTENRITVARNNYIKTVQEYNVLSRSFPTNVTARIFGYAPKQTFSVQNEAEISRPPTVDFQKK